MCEQIVLEWRRGQTDGWQMTERQRKTTAYPIIICPAHNAHRSSAMQIYYNVAEVKERGRRDPTRRPGAVHDRGKSEFGEGSGEREGSLLFSDGKEEEGERKLSAGI